MSEKLSFEEKLKTLETLVKGLESKDISLEDAISKYKQGLQLSKELYEEIKKAEKLIVEEV